MSVIFYGCNDRGFDRFVGVVVGEGDGGFGLLVGQKFVEFVDLSELPISLSEQVGLE